jgi:hypothetical protein
VDSDDVVSGLDCPGCGHGGVNSAAHCCKYSHAGFLCMWELESLIRLRTAAAPVYSSPPCHACPKTLDWPNPCF